MPLPIQAFTQVCFRTFDDLGFCNSALFCLTAHVSSSACRITLIPIVISFTSLPLMYWYLYINMPEPSGIHAQKILTPPPVRIPSLSPFTTYKFPARNVASSITSTTPSLRCPSVKGTLVGVPSHNGMQIATGLRSREYHLIIELHSDKQSSCIFTGCCLCCGNLEEEMWTA